MGSLKSWGAMIALTVCFTGCRDVLFDHEVEAAGDSVDAGPFLGVWNVISMGGDSLKGSGTTVTISPNDDGVLLVAVLREVGTMNSEEFVIRATRVDHHIVVSVRNQMKIDGAVADEWWYVLRASLRDEDKELVLADVKSSVIRKDVDNGTLSGKIMESEGRSVVGVAASSAELRSYFTSNPDIFEDLIVLRRP